MTDFDQTLPSWATAQPERPSARRVRRFYDHLARIYPAFTLLFHSKAHRSALDLAQMHDGMRVLEVATGSGEMFRRLVRANPNGTTVGLDLSPQMAARTGRRIRREFPHASTLCQAVDARYLPFPDGAFDVVVCCYLLELLSEDDGLVALREIRRVLRSSGALVLVCIGQSVPLYNRYYETMSKLIPAFLGRQVDHRLPELVRAGDFEIRRDRRVRQGFYPSRILVASPHHPAG